MWEGGAGRKRGCLGRGASCLFNPRPLYRSASPLLGALYLSAVHQSLYSVFLLPDMDLSSQALRSLPLLPSCRPAVLPSCGSARRAAT